MTPSSPILRAIKELTQDNISYTSDTGKNYDLSLKEGLDYIYLYRKDGSLTEGSDSCDGVTIIKNGITIPLI